MSTITDQSAARAAYVDPASMAALIASPVWAAISNDHRQAIRAMNAYAGDEPAANGRLPLNVVLMSKWRVPRSRIGFAISDLITLKVFVKSKGEGDQAFRMSWLPTHEGPAGNDFLSADITAWKADTFKVPSRSEKAFTDMMDMVIEAMAHPAHLAERDTDLLEAVKWMLRTGTLPSERQGWAVKAIRNRIRKEIDSAAAPGSLRPDAPSGNTTPRSTAHEKASAIYVPPSERAPYVPPAEPATPTTPADPRIAVGCMVTHALLGPGIVTLIDGEKLTISFTSGITRRVMSGFVTFDKPAGHPPLPTQALKTKAKTKAMAAPTAKATPAPATPPTPITPAAPRRHAGEAVTHRQYGKGIVLIAEPATSVVEFAGVMTGNHGPLVVRVSNTNIETFDEERPF